MKHEMHIAMDIAYNAANIIMDLYKTDIHIETKTNNTPVTEADQRSNDYIVGELQRHFPQDGIISEEGETIHGNGRYWCVDPIDGTRGFINQTGEFAIHIGLAQEGKAVLGVVYRPTTDQLYVGAQGLGAKIIERGVERRLEVQGLPNRRIGVVGHRTKKNLDYLSERVQLDDVIHTGSEGLRFMKLAENLGDIHYIGMKGGGPWDLMGPQAILEAAGGFVAHSTGEELTYDGTKIVKGGVIATRSKEMLEQLISRT